MILNWSICFLVLTFLTGGLFGQTLLESELPFDFKRESYGHCMIQNKEGDIVIGGHYLNKGQETAFVSIIDPKQEEKQYDSPFKWTHPGSITSLLQTQNGQYLLGGYTWEENGNSKVPRLIRLEGLTVLNPSPIEAKIGQVKGQILDVVQSKNGDIWATGELDGKIKLLRWTEEKSLLKIIDLKVANPSAGNALTIYNDSIIILAGYQKIKKRKNLLSIAIRMDDYEKVWQYKSNTYSEAKEVVVDAKNQIIFAITNNKKTSYGLVFKDLREALPSDILDKGRKEEAHAVTISPDNKIIFAGYTYNHFPGARRSNLWANSHNPNLSNDWNKPYEMGGKFQDEAKDVLVTEGEDIIILGNIRDEAHQNKHRIFLLKRSPIISDILSVYLNSPINYKKGDTIHHNQKSIKIEAVISSAKPLIEKNCKIHNKPIEQSGQKGSKIFKKISETNGIFRYEFTCEVALSEGLNEIQVVVEKDGITAESTTITIEYSNLKRLFVLSIGIPGNDLEYTQNDAEDFAQIMETQEGGNYSIVDIEKLNNVSNTEKSPILKKIIDYEYEKQIGRGDLFIFLISSHGRIINDQFKIIPSDFDDSNKGILEHTTIDFKEDILSKIEHLEAQKLILIDACHSGGAKEGEKVSNVLVESIPYNVPGTTIITSCGKGQLSWEDSKWKVDLNLEDGGKSKDDVKLGKKKGNGAFVSSIIEAFNNEKDSDLNGDKELSVEELRIYLQREVPRKVKEVKKATQIPIVLQDDFDGTLTIFNFKKN